MATLDQQRTHKYIAARHQHPAWLLLAPEQAPLDVHLRSLDRGRLEQEFLPPERVTQAIGRWMMQDAASSPEAGQPR